MANTQYVILRQTEQFQTEWKMEGRIEASSAEQAIKSHAVAKGVAGRYRAVPARSWSIVVEVEFEEAPRAIFKTKPETAAVAA